MSDAFISLECPYCGSNLQLDRERNILVCPACGSEHIFKQPQDSSFPPLIERVNQCPICKRNDQVNKVSAIIGSHVQETNGTMEQTVYNTDSKGNVYTRAKTVPIHATQTTRLAEKLMPPPKPVNDKKPGCAWGLRWVVLFYACAGILAGILSIISIIRFLFNHQYNYNEPPLIMGFVYGIIGFLLLRWFNSLKKKHAIALENYNDYEQELQDIIIPRWQRSMARWNNAYYCMRDDIVFIKEENSYIEADRFREWLDETTN